MTQLAESLEKCKVEGNVLFLPAISEGPLTNYQEVRKALLNAGAKYKKNTFIFNSDAQPFIDRLCSGESVNIKKEFQFFPTPDHLADKLVELAEINSFDDVLEPSAGQGAIVKAIQRSRNSMTVYGCEIMPENCQVLDQIQGFELLGHDFITECDTQFDRIIANPPFSKNQDIDHIRKMYDCLNPGGRIVTIASNHWQHSNNKKETAFRDWIEEVGVDLIPIESGEFKASETMVSTCILVIIK